MTQAPSQGSPAGGAERGGGYRRSSSGLIGALIITVLVVLAYAGFRAVTRDTPDVTPEAVDWKVSLAAARTDGQLQAIAPTSLPSRWRATSATYTSGAEPAWHLGMLTSDKLYVGIEESYSTLSGLVSKHVDENAETGDEVTVAGQQWQVFTDRGGDYALGRTITSDTSPTEAQLVVGSATPSTIRAFVAQLSTGD